MTVLGGDYDYEAVRITISSECKALRKISLTNNYGLIDLKLRVSLMELKLNTRFFNYRDPLESIFISIVDSKKFVD